MKLNSYTDYNMPVQPFHSRKRIKTGSNINIVGLYLATTAFFFFYLSLLSIKTQYTVQKFEVTNQLFILFFLKAKKKKKERTKVFGIQVFFILFSSKNPGKENIMVYTNILSNTCYY